MAPIACDIFNRVNLLAHTLPQRYCKTQHHIILPRQLQQLSAGDVVKMAYLVMLIYGHLRVDVFAGAAGFEAGSDPPTDVVVHSNAPLRTDDRLDGVARTAQRRLAAVVKRRQVGRQLVGSPSGGRRRRRQRRRRRRRVEKKIAIAEDVVRRRVDPFRESLFEPIDELSQRGCPARKNDFVEVDDDDMAKEVHVAVNAVVDDRRTVQKVLVCA